MKPDTLDAISRHHGFLRLELNAALLSIFPGLSGAFSFSPVFAVSIMPIYMMPWPQLHVSCHDTMLVGILHHLSLRL